MLRFVCLALTLALASAALTFKECGKGEVKSVEITGCSSSPCTLHKGKEITIAVTFVANEDSEKAKIELIADIGLLKIQVPHVEKDACKFMSCPVKKGDTKVLKYTVTIPSSAPTITADVTAKLIGDGRKTLACGTIHGSIAN